MPATPNSSTSSIPCNLKQLSDTLSLPLVSREWRNGSNSSCNCTPFLHSLLTKGKYLEPLNWAKTPSLTEISQLIMVNGFRSLASLIYVGSSLHPKLHPVHLADDGHYQRDCVGRHWSGREASCLFGFEVCLNPKPYFCALLVFEWSKPFPILPATSSDKFVVRIHP